MYRGKADVVVSDGFAGNLTLKIAEGFREYLLRSIASSKVGPEVKEQIGLATAHQTPQQAGAPVLGVRGIVIKCHGWATAVTISNAIKLTAAFIKGKLNDHIVDELRKLSWSSAWFSKWFTSKEDE